VICRLTLGSVAALFLVEPVGPADAHRVRGEIYKEVIISEDRHRMEDDLPRHRVTYIGHASAMFQNERASIVMDPIFSERLATFFSRRLKPLRFDPRDIRNLAGVLISHGHHDHMDIRSLKMLGKGTPIIVPKGVSLPLKLRRFRDVRVLRPWGQADLDGFRVSVVPSHHFGGRPPFYFTAGYQGYVVDGGTSVYFAGDTGFDAQMFREIGGKFTIDLAMLPIGAYHPPSFRKHHMSPEDALEAFRLLGAKRMMPIHFETFNMSWEPIDEPRRRLLARAESLGIKGSVVVLESGESTEI